MEENAVVEMLVKKTVADEISQKGLAEIAMRRFDAKFDAMVKCKVLGQSSASDGIPQQILSAAQKLTSQERSTASVQATLRQVTSTVKLADTRLTAISGDVRQLATQADSVLQLSKNIQALSFINAGLSLANIAVDVVGFAILNERLKEINAAVKELSSALERIEGKVNEIHDTQKNDLISECEKLIMRSKKLLAKIANNEPIDRDQLEDHLIEMNAYLSKIIRHIYDENFDIDQLLEMLVSLLPVYTLLLNTLIKLDHFSKHTLPVNFDNFIEIFQTIISSKFRTFIQDHYFLSGAYRYHEIQDILNSMTLFALNSRLQIDDQVAMLESIKSEADYVALEADLDALVKQRLEDSIEVIAAESGVSAAVCQYMLLE